MTTLNLSSPEVTRMLKLTKEQIVERYFTLAKSSEERIKQRDLDVIELRDKLETVDRVKKTTLQDEIKELQARVEELEEETETTQERVEELEPKMPHTDWCHTAGGYVGFVTCTCGGAL